MSNSRVNGLLWTLLVLVHTSELFAQVRNPFFSSPGDSGSIESYRYALSGNWVGANFASGHAIDIQGDTIMIASVNQATYTNRDTIAGAGIYSFSFRSDVSFSFSWRISTSYHQEGTALLFGGDEDRRLSLSRIMWSDHGHLWRDISSSYKNVVDRYFRHGKWHDVEIHDTGVDVTVLFDGEPLPFFAKNHILVDRYFADIEHGYVGIGVSGTGTVQFRDLTFTSKGVEDPPIGRMALDLDADFRDQGVREIPFAIHIGEEIVIDIVAASGAAGIARFQAIVGYDSELLEYVGFQTRDLMPSGEAIVSELSADEIQIGGIITNGTVSRDAGSLGYITFKVLPAFGPGQTTAVFLRDPQFDDPIPDWPVGEQVALGRPWREDFNEDGILNFADFMEFVSQYGKTSKEVDFDGRFDLNQDGSVNFADFLQFAVAVSTPLE